MNQEEKKLLKVGIGTMLLIIYYLVFAATASVFALIYLLRYLIIAPSPVINGFIFIALPLALILLPIFLQIKMKRSEMKSAFLSFIALSLYIGMYFGVVFFSQKYYEEFTAAKWQDYRYYRYMMFDDLSRQHDFVGMNISTVVEILGEPETDLFMYNEEENRLLYLVRNEGLNQRVLVLETEAGIVTSAELVYWDW